MTLNRFVFKTHKWLAVATGLFTVLWFVSGILMVAPRNLLGGGSVPDRPASEGGYKDVTVTVPQAVAAVEALMKAPQEIAAVELRHVNGRLTYGIRTPKWGTFLIDAMDGRRVEITEEVARQVATRAMGGRAQIREVTLLEKHTLDYIGMLPAYRFTFDDPGATRIYVGQETGEMGSSDWKGRVRGLITGTHTFEFLRPVMSGRAVKVWLVLFSIVGTAMSVFGVWILWIQWKNWLARRAGRATAES